MFILIKKLIMKKIAFTICVLCVFSFVSIAQSLQITINSVQNVNCNGADNGAIKATATGGTPPYAYVWSPSPFSGQGTDSIFNLYPATYSVTVTDSNNNYVTAYTFIYEPSPLVCNIVIENQISCYGFSDGIATVIPSGGTFTYEYFWSNGDTTSTATYLSAGGYGVTVTDFYGCVTVDSVTISQPPIFLIDTITKTDETNNDGTATIYVRGGTPPYMYNWSNGQHDTIATGLSQNLYGITVTDITGCSIDTMIIIEHSNTLSS